VQFAKSDKKCKCGSTKHKYISHHKCPLNKKNNQPCVRRDTDNSGSTTDTCDSDDTESAEEMTGYFCTCGSARTHSRSCPLNPQNYHVQ